MTAIRSAIVLVLAAVALVGAFAPAGQGAGVSVSVTGGVSYGAQPWQKLDVYRPAGKALPIVLLVHGGSWIAGGRADVAAQAQQLAGAGFVVLAVDYRLASATTAGYSQQLVDVKTATKWAVANAASIGGSSSRIGMVGGSAGGHLAALAAEDLNAAVAGRVRAVATLSAPLDLYALTNAILAAGRDGTGSGLPEFLGCALASCAASALKSASPMYRLSSRCPAFYVAHSESEAIPLAETSAFVTRAQGFGCSVQTEYLPGSAHGMAYWPSVVDNVVAFLRAKV